MPTINDTLKTLLEGITGLTGLTLNDQLHRLATLDYVIPPRTAADPSNPPLGAIWTNTATGKIMIQTALGKKEIATV